MFEELIAGYLAWRICGRTAQMLNRDTITRDLIR